MGSCCGVGGCWGGGLTSSLARTARTSVLVRLPPGFRVPSLPSAARCSYRVDLPCPRGWWGNPVCGPCLCAVSKGFDPDCNKTTGQCQCKVRCPHVRVHLYTSGSLERGGRPLRLCQAEAGTSQSSVQVSCGSGSAWAIACCSPGSLSWLRCGVAKTWAGDASGLCRHGEWCPYPWCLPWHVPLTFTLRRA